MKLAGRQANGYFAKPETNRSGLLIYGADAMRVALKRQQVIAALIGPEGDLTSEEYAAARAAGFRAVVLGPTVLRAENAALACVAITQALAKR